MEHRLLKAIVSALRALDNPRTPARFDFSDERIVTVYYWSVIRDRPTSWACRKESWPPHLRKQPLPSPATMSRRLRSASVVALLDALERRVTAPAAPGLFWMIDGKPLVIGGCSKDRQAGYGKAAGGKAKGYKLHAVWAGRPLPEAWEVTPMNTSEKVVAHRLLPQLDYGGYLLADGNYDASYLYDAAFARGYQLVSPCREAKTPGCGKHYQGPHRLRGLAILQGGFGKALFRARTAIERSFGNATSFGGGLGPLPAWVRGLGRVRTWVWAKLLINGVRIRYG